MGIVGGKVVVDNWGHIPDIAELAVIVALDNMDRIPVTVYYTLFGIGPGHILALDYNYLSFDFYIYHY